MSKYASDSEKDGGNLSFCEDLSLDRITDKDSPKREGKQNILEKEYFSQFNKNQSTRKLPQLTPTKTSLPSLVLPYTVFFITVAMFLFSVYTGFVADFLHVDE